MNRLAILAAAAAILAGPALAADYPVTRVELVAGQVHVLRAAGFYKEVVIPAPEVADVSGLTDRRLAIQARKDGNTSILLVDADGNPVEQINVRVVPEIMQGRKLVTVRSGSTKPVQNYWCAEATGCTPDPNNKAPEIVLVPVPDGRPSITHIENNTAIVPVVLPGRRY